MNTIRRLLLAMLPAKRVEITPESEPYLWPDDLGGMIPDDHPEMILDRHTGRPLEVQITDLSDRVIISPYWTYEWESQMIVISLSDLQASVNAQREALQ